MKIIDELKNRAAANKNEDEIENKLYTLVKDISKEAESHLKRVIQVLPEFDMHDASHSEKVVENIEQILQGKINLLSYYELFLIQSAAYLHDCGMAPFEWELTTFKLTEGSDLIKLKDSLNNDLKPTLTFSEASKFISENTKKIYNDDYSEVSKSLFPPQSEEKLIEDLAGLLREYQEFRNGYAEDLKSIKDEDEYVELNNVIRTDYIRIRHHIRVEALIKNMAKRFENTLGQAWGKKLATDLAIICRAHGENIDYVNLLDSDAHYKGAESANLQFVAILLRLGDIIHFNDDRAPAVLRSSRVFKSEYSFLQWAMKDNGVNYTIKDGEISFKAYCDSPLYFFKLQEYIDWIDIEIRNYLKLSSKWGEKYIIKIEEKVNRKDIKSDNEVFEPKMGLRFSLNQRKIIELLMGVGLYKNKYACIRELYQNSLDACRCMLSQLNKEGRSGKGKVVFDLEKSGEDVYLTCCDNGIGMSRDVIENFFLKIGTSYYKSPQFYRKQAEWGGVFTPTSQFGIGVLSCFMLGVKLDITTKMDGEDYVSCAVEGPHEYFYYKKVRELDKEKINKSGTLIKILLDETTKKELINLPLDNLGFCLLTKDSDIDYLISREDCDSHIYMTLEAHRETFRIYKNHLYAKIEEMVKIVPQNMTVEVMQSNGIGRYLFSKAIVVDYNNQETFSFNKKDIPIINYLNRHRSCDNNLSYEDIINSTETYNINIEGDKGVTFRTVLTFPKNSCSIEDLSLLSALPIIDGDGVCVDGILAYIDRGIESNISVNDYYGNWLSSLGLLDFTGAIRPKLSVDRTSIVDYPEPILRITKEIVEKLVIKILETAILHIEKNKLNINSHQYNLVWSYIFDKFSFASLIFIQELSKEKTTGIFWRNIKDVAVCSDQMSLQSFILADHIDLIDPNIDEYSSFIKTLVFIKILQAKKIEVKDQEISISSYPYDASRWNNMPSIDFYNPIIKVDSWSAKLLGFDLITSKSTFIPNHFFSLISDEHESFVESDYIKRSYLIKYLSEQNPIFVRHIDNQYIEKGLYYSDHKIGQFKYKKNEIRIDSLYDEKNKISNILYIYIAPKKLTEEEELELTKFKDDKEYLQGINEGWSVLVTGMEIDNIVIGIGVKGKGDLTSMLSKEFWETYSDWTFKFTDGSIMSK